MQIHTIEKLLDMLLDRAIAEMRLPICRELTEEENAAVSCMRSFPNLYWATNKLGAVIFSASRNLVAKNMSKGLTIIGLSFGS